MKLEMDAKRIVILVGAALIILLVLVQIFRESGYDFTITETDSKGITLYLGNDDNYYLYGIDSVSVKYEEEDKSLKELISEGVSLEELTRGFKKKDYEESNSTLYQGKDVNIIVCHRNNGDNTSDDVYIGSTNMKYSNEFCGEG